MIYKLILLPTNKISAICKSEFGLHFTKSMISNVPAFKNQLLILVSDKEIKKDENYIAWETNYATEPNERWVIYNKVFGLNGNNQQKIIATSSKELTPNSIISVDKQKEIVEYYNENGVLLEVSIIPNGDCNYESDGTDECLCGSKSFKDCNSYCNAPSYINSEIQFDIVKQTKEQTLIKKTLFKFKDFGKEKEIQTEWVKVLSNYFKIKDYSNDIYQFYNYLKDNYDLKIK